MWWKCVIIYNFFLRLFLQTFYSKSSSNLLSSCHGTFLSRICSSGLLPKQVEGGEEKIAVDRRSVRLEAKEHHHCCSCCCFIFSLSASVPRWKLWWWWWEIFSLFAFRRGTRNSHSSRSCSPPTSFERANDHKKCGGANSDRRKWLSGWMCVCMYTGCSIS